MLLLFNQYVFFIIQFPSPSTYFRYFWNDDYSLNFENSFSLLLDGSQAILNNSSWKLPFTSLAIKQIFFPFFFLLLKRIDRKQKRHWCIEQYFGLCGRGRGWDDLGEWHWNMYNIIYETSHQSRFDAQYWRLGVGALGWPRGMVLGGRREEGSGWGRHVYLWRIHFDIWQNQYSIVKLKNKIKLN